MSPQTLHISAHRMSPISTLISAQCTFPDPLTPSGPSCCQSVHLDFCQHQQVWTFMGSTLTILTPSSHSEGRDTQ